MRYKKLARNTKQAMKKADIYHGFKDQSRWDDAGRAHLGMVEHNPEKWTIDPDKLSGGHANLLTKLRPMLEGKVVLELGSGRGVLGVAMAKLGATVTGIDIGSALVQLGRKVAEINRTDCEFIVGTISKLPFESECFDLVVGSAVLHHLPVQGVRDAISESHRVLKPSGKAVFSEPIEDSSVVDYLKSLVPVGKPGSWDYRPSRLQLRKWRKYLAESDDRHLSTKEFLSAQNGFQRVEFDYYGITRRLARFLPFSKKKTTPDTWNRIDKALISRIPPARILAGRTLVTYHKGVDSPPAS